MDFGKYEYVEQFMINLIEHPDTLFDMTSYITDGDNAKGESCAGIVVENNKIIKKIDKKRILPMITS